MGCASAKPRVPEVVQYEGELPLKKRSQALFSRGESQFDDLEDEKQGTPAQISAIAAAATQQAILQTVAEVEVGSDGVLKAEPPKSPERPKTPPKTPPKPPSPTVAPPSPIVAAATSPVAAAPPTEVAAEDKTETNEEEDADVVKEDEEPSEEKADVPSAAAPQTPPASDVPAPMATAFAVATGTENSGTVEDRLNRVEQVIYPSAKAALSAKGLKQYIPEMEKRGVIEYRDLANVVEDLSDPFWSRMPPIPDRKKMRAVIEEARTAYGLPRADHQQTPPSTPPSAAKDENEEEEEEIEKGDEIQEEAQEAVPVQSQAAASEAQVAAEPPAEGEVDAPAPPTPPRQKQATPCDEYETDIYAADFGMCLCGHPKKAHGNLAKTPSYAQRQASQAVVVETPKDGSVCNNYKVNMKATEFGTCMCGHPKAAHGAAGQNSAPTNRFKDMAKGSFNKNSPMIQSKPSSDAPAAAVVATPSKPPPPAGPAPSVVAATAAAAEAAAAAVVEEAAEAVEETAEALVETVSEAEAEAPKVLQPTSTDDNLL